MASRMERYYRSNNPKRRSQLNQDLYHNIYEDGEYSNIEGVAMIDKSNEIDITKVKKMLKNREDYKRQKEYRNLIKIEEEPKEDISQEFLSDESEKTYDIMDVLKVAKENKDEDNRYLSLDNTNYNILKQLKIEKENKKVEKDEGEELKELINTITNTSMLNKLGDEELSLKLLEDLKGDTKTVKMENKDKIDDTFYTSSMKINKEDFEDGYIPSKKEKIIKISVIATLVVLAVVVIIFIITKIF